MKPSPLLLRASVVALATFALGALAPLAQAQAPQGQRSQQRQEDPRQRRRGPQNSLVELRWLEPDPPPPPPPPPPEEPDDGPVPIAGYLEVGHLVESVDLSSVELQRAAVPPPSLVSPEIARGGELGLGRQLALGIGVGVELRVLPWLRWTIFGFDLLFGPGSGRWVALGGAQEGTELRVDSYSLLRMGTAPGLNVGLGPVRLFARARFAAGIGEVVASSRARDGSAHGDGTLSTVHWEVGYDAGLAVGVGWVDLGVAFRHHLVNVPAWGVSAIASFRFVRSRPDIR